MEKISIVMPTYNRQDYIAEAINSCLRQTYDNLELIIVDDGSTDHTKKVVDYYVNNDKRVKYYYKNNGGPASAMNYGIKRSTGSVVCFAASDDVQEPTRLEIISKAIKRVDFCYSGYYHANPLAEPWEEVKPNSLTPANIKKNICMSGGAVACKKYVFDKIQFRDLRLNEDQALAWDLYRENYKYAMIDIPLFRYRLLTDGLSYGKQQEVQKIVQEINKEIDDYEKAKNIRGK